MRTVNTTLEPAKIAELVVERAATWVPAPCWAIVCADLSGLFEPAVDLSAGTPEGTWQVRADGGMLELAGHGGTLDALRALCRQAWQSAEPPTKVVADGSAAAAAIEELSLS